MSGRGKLHRPKRRKKCHGCGLAFLPSHPAARYCDACRESRADTPTTAADDRSILDDIVESHSDPNPDEADLDDWL